MKDNATLRELDRVALELLRDSRPARLLERREELARLDFRGHPWARLLVACVLWEADPHDTRCHRHAVVALREFRRRGDPQGECFACSVLGSWAAARGDLAEAGRWWEQAHGLVGAGAPGCELTLVHRGLAAYAQGQLRPAIAMAEEAAALARLHDQPRAEATALVNVGFFRLWTGEFAEALSALDTAEDAFGEVPDPFDRYESPLCFAARGVLWALRGDAAVAERDFTLALQAAQAVGERWYEAIVRALRAEFTACADPRRARRDARWARAELDRRGERWWRTWAIQAAGVAALASGMPTAAETTLREILDLPQSPLERARTLLLLGEVLLRGERHPEAAAVLREAVGVFDAAGARYWAARCCVRLARAEPDRTRAWMTQARRGDPRDPAFTRLFADVAELRLVAFGPGRILCGGQPLSFRTHNAERALFLLALAGEDGLHVEELAGRLWPDEPVDRRRLLGRVRTLLWDVRQGLGSHAWRLDRHGPTLRLDMTGAAFDLAEARAARTSAAAQELRRPVLTRWTYDEWVVEQSGHNHALADRLTAGNREGPGWPAR